MSGEEEERIPVSSWPPPDQEDAGNEERDEGRKRKSDEEGKPFKRRSVEDSKEEFSCESVEVLLARWYRQEGSSLRMKYPHLPKPGAASPHTVLHLAAATGEGAQVLREGLRRLEERGGKNTFLYHYHRARILDRLGEHESALSSNWTALAIAGVDSRQLRDLPATRYLDVAATLGEERRAALWLQYRLQHQLHLTQHTSTSTSTSTTSPSTTSPSTTSLSPSPSPSGLVVARVEAAALTRERFLQEFAGPRLPLLITGSTRPTRHQWSLEHLRRVAGHCKVQARSPVPGSREWGGLEAGREGALGDLLAGGFPTPGSYLFDWSLPLHCPELAGDFIVPQIVGENYLTLTSPSALYHNSWPSLFVASAGTNSGLHIDAFGSHFWMYLVEGRKRWTFFPAGQVGQVSRWPSGQVAR